MLKVMDRVGLGSEPQLSPGPPSAAHRDLGPEAARPTGKKKKKAAIGIKHEKPVHCGMLAVCHSLQLGQATCACPVGLSGIGIDTLGCTEEEI